MWGDEGRNHGHSHGQVTPGWPEGLIQWGPGSPRLEAGEESPRLGSLLQASGPLHGQEFRE